MKKPKDKGGMDGFTMLIVGLFIAFSIWAYIYPNAYK